MSEEEREIIRKYGGVFNLPDDFISESILKKDYGSFGNLAVAFIDIIYFIRARTNNQKTRVTKAEIVYMLEQIIKIIKERF